MNYAAIMAGGIGSRFWPASRQDRPKQFLDILGTGKSLLRLTFERFQQLIPEEHIYILTNQTYQSLVLEHLPELRPDQVLCEPSRNNTAPCIAYTALKLQDLDPQANMVVAPSDHLIQKEDAFLEHLQRGLAFTAHAEALLTLGIQPTRPDTGYGYIQFDKAAGDGIYPVSRFAEKPPLEKAQAYLQSGDYLWNAGIFIWRAQSVLKAFQEHARSIYDILNQEPQIYNTAAEQAYIEKTYPKTPSISIDYAIMEKAQNVYTLPADIGWSDLGTWASLHEQLPKDDAGNSAVADAVWMEDTQNSLIRMPKDKLLVVKGLEDFIIVDEGDVLLIYPKSEEQNIKSVRDQIGRIQDGRFL